MRLLCNVLLLGFALVSAARAASPASADALPFEYSEGLLWVQLEVQLEVPQSARPLNFLFDTGAEMSVINADTAKALGLAAGSKIQVRGVGKTTTGHWPVPMAAKAGGLEMPAKYLSLDLSRLAQSCERPLDGLLGMDFLQGRVVEIDFTTHLIHFREELVPAKLDIDLPMKVSGNCYCVPVRVNRKHTQWVRLDTGCATALQWVNADSAIGTTSKKTAIGLAGLAIPQTQTTVSLGNKEFDQVPTGLHRRAIFAGESGLLGNGLLNLFKTVTIDTKTKRLVLTPL
jgi:predicted aspartyl protease